MGSHTTISVIGAGAWGTALANAVAEPQRAVTLYARDATLAAQIEATGANPKLPGIGVKPGIALTSDIARAAVADVILLVVPAQSLRAAMLTLAPHLKTGTPVVACAKGIERGSRKFMTEIIAEVAPRATPAILSGPSFASDVARGLPTAITVAASDEAIAASLASSLGSPMFRPYHTSDVRGVEIGGAAKNVLAIAAGIVAGRELGASALAALTTRGFAELARFGEALGARSETLMGLSGLGDLLLSCSSVQSRNFSFGMALGRGETPDAASGGKLAEGAFTASVLRDIAREKTIDMPITEAVVAVLGGQLSVSAAIDALMTRPFKAET
jgi:glycerol-3-phosphate dehydrogenase (NAD(P)+)